MVKVYTSLSENNNLTNPIFFSFGKWLVSVKIKNKIEYLLLAYTSQVNSFLGFFFGGVFLGFF